MGGILERSEVSTSFAKLVWLFEKQKQSWNLLEPKIFDMCKNVTILMIAVLDHSEVDTEILDTSMEIAESNDCREVSRDDRDINNVLAMM